MKRLRCRFVMKRNITNFFESYVLLITIYTPFCPKNPFLGSYHHTFISKLIQKYLFWWISSDRISRFGFPAKFVLSSSGRIPNFRGFFYIFPVGTFSHFKKLT